MVLPRVLTSLLLVPVVCAAVWFGSIPFFLLVLAICLFSGWEFSLMAEEGGYPNALYMVLGGVLLVVLALFFDGAPVGPVRAAPTPLFVFVAWSFALFARELIRSDKGHSVLRVMTSLSAIAICGLFLGHLLLIRDLRLAVGEGFQLVGRRLTFFLIVIIWILDTACWAVGKSIGRTPLAPSISPKKTWEGTIGGTLIAVLAGWLIREALLRQEMGRAEAVLYSVVICVAAQLSDLIESLLKRSFGVKDSSQLLPGHGGFLDRFDSFVFAAPLFYYLLVGSGRFK